MPTPLMTAIDQKPADPASVVDLIVPPHREPDGLAVGENRERRPTLIAQLCQREIAGSSPHESPLILRDFEVGNGTPVAMTDGNDPNTHSSDTEPRRRAGQGRDQGHVHASEPGATGVKPLTGDNGPMRLRPAMSPENTDLAPLEAVPYDRRQRSWLRWPTAPHNLSSRSRMRVPSSWHHGLVADYWATANLDASELDLYRRYLRSPILDAGCGAGRLLAPLHDEGFEIDGCDASADMVERCRQRTPDATLWISALHQLTPPRPYGSIICSGVLGLGSTLQEDRQAIQRLHDALQPGGTLVLVNDEEPFEWRVRDWNEPSDGEISLCTRVDAVDEADRCVQMTIRAETRDGRREEHRLTMRLWYRDDLLPLLHDAGFAQVDVLTGIDESTSIYVAVHHSRHPTLST